MPSALASCFASSVLPTPVGPVNRNEPIGFSGARSPARDSLIADGELLDRLVLPEDHRPRSDSSRSLSCALSEVDTWRGGICAIFATTSSMSADVDA